jgi:AAA family ATP:ADP antiporter
MLSEAECYRTLLERKDSKLKLAVLYLIEKTNDSKYKPLVELVLNDTNENIRNKAAEILNKI